MPQKVYNAIEQGILISSILLLVISASEAIDTMNPHLVACWFCDEGQGDKVKDASTNGLDGNIMGDVKWSKIGKYNGCLEFPGNVESYVEVTHSERLNLKEFTVAAWVKSEKVDDYQSIVVKSDGSTATRQYSLYTRTGSGALHTDINVGGNRCKTYGSVVVCDGKWHHVALTYDGKMQLLYVDGKKDAGDEAEAQCAGDLVEAVSALTIGRDSPNGVYPLFGMLDEIVLFKRALEQKEVDELIKGISMAVNPKGCLAILWGKLKQE